MNIEIIPLLSEHQEFLWEMLYQALFVPKGQEPFPHNIIHHPEIKKYAQNWGNKNDTGLMVVDSQTGEKIGAAWFRLFTKENKGFGYIDDHIPELAMALKQDYRGKGIGTKLLTELLNKAKRNYKAISLSVEIENPALKLYERFGFKQISQIDTSLTMIKNF
jgi:ribosomal protein S18 acetylase RimI-like enzyme